MLTSWHSYPKIYNLGHPQLENLFKDPVLVEEKVDGSQFSFARFGKKLFVRSKSREFDIEAPHDLFEKAVEVVKNIADKLQDGWTYRGEYLTKPKHNSLAYERIPKNHIIIFDINPSYETYLSFDKKKEEASRLGLEVVPTLFQGKIDNHTDLFSLLENTSTLGKAKIEGIVIKNYSRFAHDGKVMMGKHVSEHFKETHSKEWKKNNPSQKDIITTLIEAYKSEARWQKAIQHLQEQDALTNSPKDIGKLIKEIQEDIFEECEEEIKEFLFQYAKPFIKRGSVRGFPEWYKEKLAKSQFEWINCEKTKPSSIE